MSKRITNSELRNEIFDLKANINDLKKEIWKGTVITALSVATAYILVGISIRNYDPVFREIYFIILTVIGICLAIVIIYNNYKKKFTK